jgi:hypothetical protein
MEEVTVIHSVVTRDTGSTDIGNWNPDIMRLGEEKGACRGRGIEEAAIWRNGP